MAEKGKKIVFKGLMKYITVRNVLIAILVFIAYLMFSDLVKAIVFTAALFPVGTLSIKISRLMPNTSIDVIGPCTFFLAYLYGFPVGAFYGIILGAFMWSRFYSLSQFVLFNLSLNGIVALLGSYTKTLGWQFQTAYIVCLIVRNILYFGIGDMIGNRIENITHTIGNSVSNLLLVPPFVFLLYQISSII